MDRSLANPLEFFAGRAHAHGHHVPDDTRAIVESEGEQEFERHPVAGVDDVVQAVESLLLERAAEQGLAARTRARGIDTVTTVKMTSDVDSLDVTDERAVPAGVQAFTECGESRVRMAVVADLQAGDLHHPDPQPGFEAGIELPLQFFTHR